MNLKTFLNQPLRIGDRTIPARLVMAPLSKLGNVAFRELVARYGGFGLLFSEMSSARGVRHDVKNPLAGYMWRPRELDYLVCQLFGEDPETMAAAAEKVEGRGFFGVDVNFGCAVGAICRSGCGAALLKTPDRAVAIVRAIRKAVRMPLSVKFRTGWEDRVDTAVDLARRFADAGADALTFHPRVAPDRRTRPPRWDHIGQVKAAVDIPVFGNGDVFSRTDCEEMVRRTGCDGVALGRLAVARPWVFAQWTGEFVPPADIYQTSVNELAGLLLQHFEPAVALRRFNRFMAYFAANFRYGHTLYARICRARSMDEALLIYHGFLVEAPDVNDRPAITLLR